MDTETPEPLTGTFHDAATGETVVRQLTAEEIAALPQNLEPTVVSDPE